jgi:hypothetical protein
MEKFKELTILMAVDMMKLGAMDYLIKDNFSLEKLPDENWKNIEGLYETI